MRFCIPRLYWLLVTSMTNAGIYLLEGEVDIHGQRFEPGRLLVFSSGDEITIEAVSAARFVLFGGEPLDSPRHVWWNFVSSSRERIEQAKGDWKNGRFASVQAIRSLSRSLSSPIIPTKFASLRRRLSRL